MLWNVETNRAGYDRYYPLAARSSWGFRHDAFSSAVPLINENAGKLHSRFWLGGAEAELGTATSDTTFSE